MSSIDTFGGTLWLRPGQRAPHNLRSTRPDWVDGLTRGLPAARLPANLGNLFSLCGHAHTVCADLAVNAALGRPEPASAGARAWLARQTLREHLRRIWLDWPRHLGPAEASATVLDAAARELAGCPALAAKPGDTQAWLQAQAIGMPLAEWLAAWQQDPAAWLQAWCERTDSLPARLLRACRDAAPASAPTVPALRVHARPEAMRDWLASWSQAGAAATRQPLWQGQCAQTGVWTRLNDTQAPRLDSAWLRLGARLAEVLRRASPAAGPVPAASAWLDLGALSVAPGEAVAWVEMARGLLIHHVCLEGSGDAATVRACHVIAPTEWNFHPAGAVAQALQALPPAQAGAPSRELNTLMAAYDPCVPFKHDAPLPLEATHA